MLKNLCYKLSGFIVLLLMMFSLCAARDYLITLLTNEATRIGPRYYALHEDFNSALEEVGEHFEEDPLIKSDYLVNEKGFKVYVYYNHRKTPRWHKLYVVLADKRVTARFY